MERRRLLPPKAEGGVLGGLPLDQKTYVFGRSVRATTDIPRLGEVAQILVLYCWKPEYLVLADAIE